MLVLVLVPHTLLVVRGAVVAVAGAVACRPDSFPGGAVAAHMCAAQIWWCMPVARHVCLACVCVWHAYLANAA